MIYKYLRTCPICKANSGLNKIRDQYDDRYGYSGKFSTMQCSYCDHVYLDTEFTKEQILHLYTEYYPRSSFNIEEFQPHQELKSSFAAWLDGSNSTVFRWIPHNVRILDIGCGFGETLGYHKARGCDVYGIEADENIRRAAERYGYKVHVGLFNANLYETDFFDYVTMDQVFEHMQNPIDVMKDIAKVLKPGGIVIISMPNAQGWGANFFGSRWLNWHTPYHLHFFSKSSLKLAAQHAGLNLETSMTLTNSAWLHLQWLHLLTYPKEGKPSLFWAQHGTLKPWQKLTRKLIMYINTFKINHVITRFFDMLGLGDNRIYFLRKP